MAQNKPLAKVKLHPAVIIIGTLALYSLPNNYRLMHPTWDAFGILQLIGAVFTGGGIIIAIFAYGAMAIARTTINPREHTTKIVTTGIYRFSRNPIYLGWFLFFLGIGFTNASLYRIIVPFLMIALLHWAVVIPEERYLEYTFGNEYLEYKAKVRRWV